jgi:hypothetical protein
MGRGTVENPGGSLFGGGSGIGVGFLPYVVGAGSYPCPWLKRAGKKTAPTKKD